MNFKQAHSSNFRKGRTNDIRYIVIHYTSNDGDTAKNNVDYYARASLKTSAHYYVDENEIWQSVKEGDTAWHCGSQTNYKHEYCRNSNSIGVEICSKYTGDVIKDKKNNTVDYGKYFFEASALQKASELVKELMQKYNIPVENVIRHYDVTGKVCPAPMVVNELAWAKFKSMLVEKPKEIAKVVIATGNDIDYVLKTKYGITFDTLEGEKAFIKELDEAREKDSKLYWVYYKLANK